MMVHKYDMSVVERGGERDKKVFVKGALVNRPRPMTDKEGMDMFLIVVSIIGRTCSGVLSPLVY